MGTKIEKWVVAQKKHRLSDKHIEMARELGLNPDKLGKIDNHKQESWKAPLPQFIEEIYYKRFKREEPETVRSLKEIIASDKLKKEQKKKEKERQRKIENNKGQENSLLSGDSSEKTVNPQPVTLSAKLKQLKPLAKVKLDADDTPETILQKEVHVFDQAFDFHETESVTLSQLGFILKKIYPQYKPRRYGYKTLREIYEKLDKYEVIQTAEEVVVCKKEK